MAKSSAGEAFEISHVHNVYDHIASHFSSTRYKVCMSLIQAPIVCLMETPPGIAYSMTAVAYRPAISVRAP